MFINRVTLLDKYQFVEICAECCLNIPMPGTQQVSCDYLR